jgi:aminoglycoside phosphotransferase (APT) family kinase protein
MLKARLCRHIKIIDAYDNCLADYLFGIIESFAAQKVLTENIVPSLIHLDFKPQNIIFHKETQSVGVIDFEHMRFGDPLHELARAKFKASQNALFLQQLWSQIEVAYIQKSHIIIHPTKLLFYQIYNYVTELSYFYQINNIVAITEMQNKIKKTIQDFDLN